MSLVKERIDNNVERINYNGKPASLSGTVMVKDLSKKGWIIIDCLLDDKITKGLTNVSKQLGVKLNVENFYCKYDGSISLSEKQKYNITAELYLSKGTTLYGKINKLTPSSLSESISITNTEKITPQKKLSESILNTNIESQNISSPITFSDETINKIRLVVKESFSEVLKETTKNISDLVEVIKELTVVIDKKGDKPFDNKDNNVPFNKNKDIPNDLLDDIPNDFSNDLTNDLSDDLPNDLSNDLSNDLPTDDTKK
jgi:hypothetical protein